MDQDIVSPQTGIVGEFTRFALVDSELDRKELLKVLGAFIALDGRRFIPDLGNSERSLGERPVMADSFLRASSLGFVRYGGMA
jgi:hypothetical protein